MGRRGEGNYIAQKKNSMEDLVGNEQNGHSVLDTNKKR
jgi:hypothetical protein